MRSAAVQVEGLASRSLDAIVIGGSAGVFEVLRIVLAGLPDSLAMPVIVVVHVPPRPSTSLPEALQGVTRLPLRQADDKEPLRNGQVYFAAPGYHLLVETNRCAALSLDEPVFYSRPSIDVLFESASDAYGSALLGILLTGASPDGAAGLQTIHERGGITIVQRPDTCEAQTMPQAALSAFQPDYVLAPSEIGALLASLSKSNR